MQPNVVYDSNFTISSGYNKLLLAKPLLVRKGSILLLSQDSSPYSTTTAVDTTGNEKYSDLIWSINLSKLNKTNNWRFFLNPITNYTSYENSFTIVHTYNNIGVYNISIMFPSSNQVFQQIVNVTDCKL